MQALKTLYLLHNVDILHLGLVLVDRLADVHTGNLTHHHLTVQKYLNSLYLRHKTENNNPGDDLI